MGCVSSTTAGFVASQPPPHQDNRFRPIASVPPQTIQNAPYQQVPVIINKDPHGNLARDEPEGISDNRGNATTTQEQAKPITKESILEYFELERRVREFESRNVIGKHEMKKTQLNDVKQTAQQLQEHYMDCLNRTAKEKADVDNMQHPSVRSFFKDQTLYDDKFSKEQEEYLEALNKQEVAQKGLDGVKHQVEELESETAGLKREVDQLMELYQQQDALLLGFFNGTYGSDEENMLEAQLDSMIDRKQRISLAKERWINSRLLLHHACGQLAIAVRKWNELPRIPITNLQLRFVIATECRNNIIAATQNISNAQRYLSTIRFPYCTADEMTTLSKACSNVYVDMQRADRHLVAMQCYSITQRRAAALLQWFDHVIDSSIKVDFESATKEVKAKELELRNERLRLLKAKYYEATGETIQLQDVGDAAADKGDPETPVVSSHAEADKVSLADDLPHGDAQDQETGENTMDIEGEKVAEGGEESLKAAEPDRAPTPLTLNDLAPTPSEDEMFGNLDELQRRHEMEIDDLMKAQDTNKTRQEQGLQQKLAERRSRRLRQEQQQNN